MRVPASHFLAVLAGAGLTLVLVSIYGSEEDPRPSPAERYACYWIEARAEGAVPVRLAADSLEFRAYVPEPVVRLRGEEDHPDSEVEVVLTNVNRDLVEVQGGTSHRWLGPTSVLVEATVRAGESAAVGLRVREPAGPIRFHVASDPELNFPLLSRFLERVRSERPDFVLVLGDLIQERRWFLDYYVRLFEEAEVPVYVAIGNHDLAVDRKNPPWEARKEDFFKTFGPGYRAFMFRGVQFVILDTGAHDLGAEQLAWLEETLAAGEPRARFLFSHKPFADPWGGEEHQIENRADKRRLRELLRQTPGVVYYCGHIEAYHVFETDGIPVRIVGSLTHADKLDRGGTNGFVDVCVAPDGKRSEERVELEPPGRGESAWFLATSLAPDYVGSRPTVALGLVLLALSGAGAAALRLARKRAARRSREGA